MFKKKYQIVIKQLLIKIYHHQIFEKIIPTLVFCLKRELADCETVLDLGCGDDSPIRFCRNIKYSVGVEVFKPYLKVSKKKKIHSKYLLKNIGEVNFREKSFDAVILIEVLEHLPETVGLQILKKAEKWARKKIIVSSPNGFIKQKEVDNNPYQKHLSGWSLDKMRNLGFKCYGLAGFKFLRKERVHDTSEADLTSSIRFQPRFLWFIIASLSQLVTYYFPQLAFELFSAKRLKQ